VIGPRAAIPFSNLHLSPSSADKVGMTNGSRKNELKMGCQPVRIAGKEKFSARCGLRRTTRPEGCHCLKLNPMLELQK
jgi:hypothetical protein